MKPALAPRAAFFCRTGFPSRIGFALGLWMLVGILPAAVAPSLAGTFSADLYFDQRLDLDDNGVEDLLDSWRAGRASWQDLRSAATSAAERALPSGDQGEKSVPAEITDFQDPATADWSAGRIRLICLGADASRLDLPLAAARQAGTVRVVHSLSRFGSITVLATDEPGLEAFLAANPEARVMLDRDGAPALAESRFMVGGEAVATGHWELGDDWSGTLAILDSGCDTAHGDLGDAGDDDNDGPAPAVGDASDWYPAANGWPLFEGYKVVGWQDVTDDFPDAQGPWDYHHHGTALASVAAGSGTVDPDLHGMAPGARLTVVKFYDFDETWHAWAGDFLAACAWTLDNRETHRIRTVLMAVNWDVDAGISTAVEDLVAAGMVPVAAMGNYGDDPLGPGYPASLPLVLTVGAVNADAAVSAYSGRGIPGVNKPDLVAPGGGLLEESGRIQAADNEPDDTYSPRMGTSLAAAHVAGAVHLLGEAMLENGIPLPGDEQAVRTLCAVLKTTAASVDGRENESGVGHTVLAEQAGPDLLRGWGLARVDAAVQAYLQPLLPGLDDPDTLTSNLARPVVARRLVTDPGVRYLVEIVPSPALDVMLEIVDPAWLEGDPEGHRVIRQDQHGAGVSEFAYVTAEGAGWLLAAAKYRSGYGTITFRLREAETYVYQAASQILPGPTTGAPNSGTVTGHSGPSLVIPSRVTVDFAARSVNMLDHQGEFRPGWPVFVFPHSSSLGGLGQPLVADMDGIPGDEIVIASDFGSLYFFEGGGSFTPVDLEINLPLTTVVGLRRADGSLLAVVADEMGVVRAWSHGPVLEAQVDLAHDFPLDPAIGVLTPGGSEVVVVAFSDGHVTALDEDFATLPGWPVDLGTTLGQAPVMADFDGDGGHEIHLPAFDDQTGQLTMRILDGSGLAAPGDGTSIPSPAGGPWLQVSPAVVAGGWWTEDLKIAVAGLASNGFAGDQAGLQLGVGSFTFGGVATSSQLAGFEVNATTAEGELQINHLILPAPVAWNYSGAAGAEIEVPVSIHWNELLYGFTSIPGSATARFTEGSNDDPLSRRKPLRRGGKNDFPVGHLGTMLVDVDGILLRVQSLDETVEIMPVEPGRSSTPFWLAARSDNRNTGAMPLAPVLSPSPIVTARSVNMTAYPNPGGGDFRFRVDGWTGRGTLSLEIFDLRGRRLRSDTAGPGEALLRWNGFDDRGRPAAAGSYLAVVRGAGAEPLVKRIVLTR